MTNYENERLYEDEIAFNIFEILKYLFKHVKTIIIAIVLGALLVPSVLYMNDMNNYNAQMNVINANDKVVLDEADEFGVEKYFLLKTRAEHLKEKVNNTDVYALDLENVYQTNIVYNISGEEAYRVDIANTIIRYVESMQFQEKNNLVYASFLGNKENVTNGVFVVSIYADSKEVCQDKKETIKSLIKDYDTILQETIATHALSIVEEESTYGYAETLYEKNKEYLDEYRNVNSEFESCKSELNEVQKSAIMQIEAQDNEDTVEITLEKPQLEIIYVVLGAILGLIVVCVILVCVYLLGGKIQTEKEIYRRTGYTHFGTLKEGSNEQMNHIITSIEIADQMGMKDVTILSTLDVKDNEQVNDLCKQLDAKGVKVQLVVNAEKDMNILSKIKEAKTVLLIETPMKTKIKSMYRVAHFCEQADADILGYIMIDK